MLNNSDILSFQDYYILEEGMKEVILQKWEDIKKISQKWEEMKNFILTKDIYGDPINTKKIRTKQDELIVLLKNLNLYGSEIILYIANTIIVKPIKFLAFYPNRKGGMILRFLAVFIPNLLAALGVRAMLEVKHSKYPELSEIVKNKTEIVQSIDSSEPTPEIEQERQKETEKIIERIWGNFENRKDFIKMVKVFEAGDYEKPNIEPKPLPAYFDRTQISIGYGTKAKENEKIGKKISEVEAHNRLIQELTDIDNKVKIMADNKKWKLTTNQLNAFVDFAFNRGPNALQSIFNKSKSIKDTIPHIQKVVFARTTNTEKAKFNKSLEARRKWEAEMLK
jgi:GH24 family phage-related lysozyme (muramidase)